MLKVKSEMEWKGCHFEKRRLDIGVVFCRVNPLGQKPELQAMDASLKNMLIIAMTVVLQQSLIVTAQSPICGVSLRH